MSTFPLYLPGDIEITSVTRTGTAINGYAQCRPFLPVPIDISVGAYNIYVVTGANLDKISSVHWYPALQSHIVFKMHPWQTYTSHANEATFGILIQDQESYDYQRGGNISFRISTGESVNVPAATFSTYPWLFNPVESPLQGWDTGAQDNGGGAY